MDTTSENCCAGTGRASDIRDDEWDMFASGAL